MTLCRPHEEVMRDYITLLKRDLDEHIESRILVRMETHGENRQEAKKAVRTTNPTRKRKKRLAKAEDHLARYLVGVAYWKELSDASR